MTMQSAAGSPHPFSLGRSIGLAILLAGLLAASAVKADEFVESVPAKHGETVDVEIDFGEGLRPDPGYIRLTSQAGDDQVRARVDTTGWGNWDVEVSLERRGGRVQLDVRARGTTTWMFGGPNIRIDVSVPEGIDVNVVSWGGNVRVENLIGGLRGTLHDADILVRNVDGRVKLNLEDSASAQIDEVRGDFEVSSDSGEIRAARIAGRSEIRAGSGRVLLDQVEGPIAIKTLDGDIELSQVNGPVTARSDRGDVRIDFSGESAGLVETEQGDVAITLPEKHGAALDARSGEGKIDLAAGNFEGERGAHHALGTIESGGPRLVVRSAGGSIRIQQQ